jgi:CBS domain containing-hemolysin-like protein
MDFMYIVAVLIVSMVILIYLSGWFSGIETALTNLDDAEIAMMRKRKAKNIYYIVKLKRDMDRTLVAILIGNNIVNIVLSVIAALVADTLFQTVGVTIMVGVITFLIIIFGEITPKSNAIMDSQKVAKKKAKKIYYMMRILSPAITFFMAISRGIIKLTGGSVRLENMLVSDQSIKDLATMGEEEGVIKAIEKDIIHSVFAFGDCKTQSVMVPLPKVFTLKKNYNAKNAAKIMSEHGYSRVPIVDKNDNVRGLLYAKDLLGKRKGVRIQSIMKKPYFMDFDCDVTKAFSDMKKRRVHLAIVRDAEGNHIGIITLEDILEELVGEIYDEYSEIQQGHDLDKKNV